MSNYLNTAAPIVEPKDMKKLAAKLRKLPVFYIDKDVSHFVNRVEVKPSDVKIRFQNSNRPEYTSILMDWGNMRVRVYGNYKKWNESGVAFWTEKEGGEPIA